MLQVHRKLQELTQTLTVADNFQPLTDPQSWTELIEDSVSALAETIRTPELKTWTLPKGTRLYKGVTIGESPDDTRSLYLGDLSICSRYAFDGGWRNCIDGQIIVYQTLQPMTLINMDARENFPILQQIAPGQIKREHNRLQIYEGMDLYLYAYGYHPDRPELHRNSDRDIDYVLMEQLRCGLTLHHPEINGIASRDFPEICLFSQFIHHWLQLLDETYIPVLTDYPEVTIVHRKGPRVIGTYLCDINDGF